MGWQLSRGGRLILDRKCWRHQGPVVRQRYSHRRRRGLLRRQHSIRFDRELIIHHLSNDCFRRNVAATRLLEFHLITHRRGLRRLDPEMRLLSSALPIRLKKMVQIHALVQVLLDILMRYRFLSIFHLTLIQDLACVDGRRYDVRRWRLRLWGVLHFVLAAVLALVAKASCFVGNHLLLIEGLSDSNILLKSFLLLFKGWFVC